MLVLVKQTALEEGRASDERRRFNDPAAGKKLSDVMATRDSVGFSGRSGSSCSSSIYCAFL